MASSTGDIIKFTVNINRSLVLDSLITSELKLTGNVKTTVPLDKEL